METFSTLLALCEGEFRAQSQWRPFCPGGDELSQIKSSNQKFSADGQRDVNE